MNQQSVDSNPDLAELLDFQDKFISIVHSDLYHCQGDLQDATLKFEIHHISEANQRISRMLESLSTSLVDNKKPYELRLRDAFQRLLQTDFLPLLRINRYELTKLSLFGFDIYIEPLEAVLQILSRLEVIKKRVIQSSNDLPNSETSESALQKGWDTYMLFCDQWRLSFNLYLLEEYLRFGGKSFLKKDREILFTGVSNLFTDLIPSLATKKNFKLLNQFGELNNCLYNFHPSFDYFHFATLLPLRQYFEPIFYSMNEILQKCLRTNILTPLLFGIIRHRQTFINLIQEADSIVWLPYLNTLISGIAINLKFRILEYQQVLEVFELAVCKAGLLGTIRTDEIVGKLEDGWKDAKEFFISAVKIGFSSGEVQTWKSVEFESIGPRVMSSVLDGMLLNTQDNPQWETYLQSAQDKLSQELRLLSENKLEWQSIKSWICQLQKPIDNEKELYSLIRVTHLINILEAKDQYSLSFVVGTISAINCNLKGMLLQRVEESVERINQFLCSAGERTLTFTQDKIIELHRKYPPKKAFSDIIKFYFKNLQPKKALSSLLFILDLSNKEQCNALASQIVKQFVAGSAQGKYVKMKTFEKELLIKIQLVNAPYEGHCILNILASQLCQHQQSTIGLIHKIIKINPSISFALLNFPINAEGKLFSFGTYLIEHQPCHQLLKIILKDSKGAILSEQKIDLIETLSFPSLCEQVYKKINETQTQQLQPFMDLLMWIYQQINPTDQQWRDLLALYLFMLQKQQNSQRIKDLVEGIGFLIVRSFGDKLSVWIAIQLIKKIQGKYHVHRTMRKRALKTSSSSIYFISQISEAEMKELLTSSDKQKQDQIIPNVTIKFLQREEAFDHFFTELARLSEMGLDKLIEIRDSQTMMLQQEIKALFIPELAENITIELFAIKEQKCLNKMVNCLGINLDNYLRFIDQAIESQNVQQLKTNRYTLSLNSKLSAILLLQHETKTNCLGDMCSSLSSSEKTKIADQLFLEASSLSYFVQFVEGIQFMVLRNNFNWRVVVDFLSKQFQTSNISSSLLEYNQYIVITSQRNSEYEALISSQASLFSKYIVLLEMKVNFIIQVSTSEQEIEIKQNNQLTFLNLILSSLSILNTATKLGTLDSTMKAKGLQYTNEWLGSLKKLQQILSNSKESVLTTEGGKLIKPILQNYAKELQKIEQGEQSKVEGSEQK